MVVARNTVHAEGCLLTKTARVLPIGIGKALPSLCRGRDGRMTYHVNALGERHIFTGRTFGFRLGGFRRVHESILTVLEGRATTIFKSAI